MSFYLKKVIFSTGYGIYRLLPFNIKNSFFGIFILSITLPFHRYSTNQSSLLLKEFHLFCQSEGLKGLFTITHTGVIQFYPVNSAYLYYFALAQSTQKVLKQSYQNYKLIRQTKDIQQLVDYELNNITLKTLILYQVEFLQPLKNSDHKPAFQYIINSLQHNSKKAPLKKTYEFEKALNKLEKAYQVTLKHLLVLQDHLIKITYMHADLTTRNIMINKEGHYVLIDLDQFQEQAPALYDPMVFQIENLREKNNKIDWTELVIKLLKQDQNLNGLDTFKPSFIDLIIFSIMKINLEHLEIKTVSPNKFRRNLKLLNTLQTITVDSVKTI